MEEVDSMQERVENAPCADVPLRPRAYVLAVVNQKGGVGKTTTAVNLAACAALSGRRVLVVDADPQGNATSGLGIDRAALEACLYDVLVASDGAGPRLSEIIQPSCVEGLDVAPATIDLAGADLALANAIARELRLRRALEELLGDYDIVIIDTAPSLGILTVNALAAAKAALIPIQCEYYALEGLSQLLQVITLVSGQINPELRIAGAVLTMYDARTRLAAEVAEEVRRNFPGRVYGAVIPRNVRVAEAPSHGLPVVVYDPGSAGAEAYWRLYREVFEDAQAGAGQGPERAFGDGEDRDGGGGGRGAEAEPDAAAGGDWGS